MAKLTGRRGLIVLVDAPKGWERIKGDPLLQDLEEDLAVVDVDVRDAMAIRLALPAPGGALLNEAGRVIAAWMETPKDLRTALAEAGWNSSEDLLRRHLQGHPGQCEAQWDLVRLLYRRASRRPAPGNLSDFAAALDHFLRMEGWAEVQGSLSELPSRFTAPVRSATLAKSTPEDAEVPLADLARLRWTDLEAAVRRNPRSVMPWSLLALLAPWRGPEEPRLAKLLMELEPPPRLVESLSSWPGEGVHERVEAQLLRLRDWAGLEAYALHQAGRLREAILVLAREQPGTWEEHFSIPGQPPPQIPFIEAARVGMGRWLVKALDAQLRQERLSAALATAAELARDGDARSVAAAASLAKKEKAEEIARILH